MRAIHWVVGASAVIFLCTAAQADIIFADFNVNEGIFQYAPNFSGTSNVLATSTADRTTAAGEVLEGAGAEKLVLNSGTANPTRCRFLAGVTTAGSPAGQQSFTPTSGGEDGYIGFWYKIAGGTATGMKLGINLDSPANTGATMVGGVLKDVIADGQWHAMEWNLDNLSEWGAVTAIGGSSANLEGSAKTIDSIYFYFIPQPNLSVTVLIDYVVKTDSGHIPIPEPASIGLLLAGIPLVASRRRK
ncbi:MAG: PEP-CTERM sorting domain-containing protein [Planctomycetes bacterium]|nr:PEP-CTERM sorting domain-containing protein [Planctomycetota bacterium]